MLVSQSDVCQFNGVAVYLTIPWPWLVGPLSLHVDQIRPSSALVSLFGSQVDRVFFGLSVGLLVSQFFCLLVFLSVDMFLSCFVLLVCWSVPRL